MKGVLRMNDASYLGYTPGDSFIHRLSGATKLICFLALSIISMTSYDTRFLIIVGVFSLIMFKIAGIKWRTIRVPMLFILAFSILNIVTIYLFSPEQGVQVYGTRHVIWEGVGRYTLTYEQILYEFNVALKYLTTIPMAFIFILTTHPSEFASSLNKIGVSYRISYAVALALRYIPDIQEEYFAIRQAQQARGLEMSDKAKFFDRIKRSANIALPLIFSSLDRIEVISQAMELRRFGKEKTRTWYSYRPFTKSDYLSLLVVGVIVVIGVWLFKVNQGRFWNPFI